MGQKAPDDGEEAPEQNTIDFEQESDQIVDQEGRLVKMPSDADSDAVTALDSEMIA